MPKGVTNAARDSYEGGKWNVNYLRFFADFMDELNVPMSAIADAAKLSRQTIYYWLKKDDAKLSSLLTVFDAFNYDLIIDLAKDRPQGAADVDIYVRKDRGGKRLGFLKDTLKRYHISQKQLMADMGLSHATMTVWFKADDIFMSYIYRIAEQCGFSVKITICPKELGAGKDQA